MNRVNKVLLGVVIVLAVILVTLVIWQGFFTSSPIYAVYLKTGDLYFGKLVRFPSFGLRDVYTLSVNQQDQQNPIRVQKFSNVFWGPGDFLKINRDEVVWMNKLSQESQLVQLVRTNPNLVPQQTQQSLPAPQQQAPTPSGSNESGK